MPMMTSDAPSVSSSAGFCHINFQRLQNIGFKLYFTNTSFERCSLSLSQSLVLWYWNAESGSGQSLWCCRMGGGIRDLSECEENIKEWPNRCCTCTMWGEICTHNLMYCTLCRVCMRHACMYVWATTLLLPLRLRLVSFHFLLVKHIFSPPSLAEKTILYYTCNKKTEIKKYF